jgi:hypothetical protein
MPEQHFLKRRFPTSKTAILSSALSPKSLELRRFRRGGLSVSRQTW